MRFLSVGIYLIAHVLCLFLLWCIDIIQTTTNLCQKKFYPDFCFYYAKKMDTLEILVQSLRISEREKVDFLLDRSVHGLYISIRHYMNNCNEKEKTIININKAIAALGKWTEIPGKVRTHKKWWNKYAELVKNLMPYVFIMNLKRKSKRRIWLYKLNDL